MSHGQQNIYVQTFASWAIWVDVHENKLTWRLTGWPNDEEILSTDLRFGVGKINVRE